MPNQDSIVPANNIPSINDGKTPQSHGVTILLNEFEVERELGRGGMGKVYLVRSRTTGRKFALKEALVKDNAQQKAFLAELQTWIDLPEHPNILACRFFRTVGNETLIFADYCESGSLADWIANGNLHTLEQKLDVAIQFAWGIHAIHERGLVHQDIKPGNVLMTKNGVPKVADFGLARAKQRMVETSEAKGAQSGSDAPVLVTSGGMTPAYASPEQRAGRALSNKTDMWSWAVSVMDMFLGEVSCPYGGHIGHDSDEVLRGLSGRLMEERQKTPRQKTARLNSPKSEDKRKKLAPVPALERFGRNLTELAAKGALPPLIGRREEMLKITRILLQSRKNNLILVGEPGVGKTGIVEGFAQLLAEGKLPDALGRPAVIEISLTSLVAGTKYRGEFEERLEAVVREASQCGALRSLGEEREPKPILFIDEIHLLLGAGSASGSMDAANILKPALARGAIRVIGATTIREYRQTIEKDGALERRFQAVKIEEPSADEAVAILLALRPRLEAHHGVALEEAALRAAVEWSVRYLLDFRLPDKALDMVDQACAAVRFLTLTPEVLVEEKSCGGTPQSRLAARRRSHLVVGREEIARAVAARCGIPVGTLTADEGVRLMALERDLGRRVKGQPEAISAVAEAVRLARAGLKKPGQPVGVFLFVGPSGTGKTELAKALAENLFHDERRLIRFDMSEFMEEHSVAKLIGSPPGYVGHNDGGQLSDAIRTHPYSVVLFDEIEKAHPKVLDLFLQIFDEGMLTDAQGRKCDFRESVIILTSNLGSGGVVKRRMGFGMEDEECGRDAQTPWEEAIRKHLRPELVNRLTKIVHFKPLGMEAAREILGKLVVDLNKRLVERGVRVVLDESAEELILREGFSDECGARNLERVMDRLLGTLVAEALLSGKVEAGQVIQVTGVNLMKRNLAPEAI